MNTPGIIILNLRNNSMACYTQRAWQVHFSSIVEHNNSNFTDLQIQSGFPFLITTELAQPTLALAWIIVSIFYPNFIKL